MKAVTKALASLLMNRNTALRDDLEGAVIGAAVDDQQLVNTCLNKQTIEHLPDALHLVERRYDDGER